MKIIKPEMYKKWKREHGAKIKPGKKKRK